MRSDDRSLLDMRPTAGGRFGVLIVDLGSAQVLACQNASSTFHMGSVVKMLVLLFMCRLVDDGKASLGDRVARSDLNDIPGGFISEFSNATIASLSVGELLSVMIRLNDSVIADYFLRTYSIERLNAFLKIEGCQDTEINSSILGLTMQLVTLTEGIQEPHNWREYYDLLVSGHVSISESPRPQNLSHLNFSTPHDLSSLLGRLLDGTLLSPTMTSFAMSCLLHQSSTERIPLLLAPSERSAVGHSIGHSVIDGSYTTINDVGFFRRSPSIACTLVFLTDRITDFRQVNQCIAGLSRLAVDYVLHAESAEQLESN